MSDGSVKGLEWKVGLQNPLEKFLTAEPFGNKVNVAGIGLKQKQTWTLELNTDGTVFLRSYLGRYLSVDKFGNIACDGTNTGEDEKFSVEYSTDGTGRWAFKHVKIGYYLGGNDEKVECIALSGSESNMSLWYAPIAIHPQVAVFNVNRQRYLILSKNELRCSEDAPWGPNALITLEFICGKYCFKTADCRYLSNDGLLVEAHSKDTQYTLELRVGPDSNLKGVTFKDMEGRYLTAAGGSAVLKCRNKTVHKDEIFKLEECPPQVVIEAKNGKKASIRNGLEVLVNVMEETAKEIFQVDFERKTKKWLFFTIDNTFWYIDSRSAIQTNKKEMAEKRHFEIEWSGDGLAAIKAENGKYISNKATGNMIAVSDSISENEQYKIKIVNRPLIVLKSEYGYVAQKVSGSNKTEYVCNKSVYDVILLENDGTGKYHLKGDNEKYWSLTTENTIKANSETPVPFILEPRGKSLVSIRAPNGKYILAEKSGGFRATADKLNANCMWHY